MTYISRRSMISGVVATMVAAPIGTALTAKPVPPWTMTKGIPDAHVRPATRWLIDNYGQVFQDKLNGTSIPFPLLCAVACQESAYTWFDREVFKQGRTPEQMMRLLVLDNVQSRGAFPRGTSAFATDPRFKDLAPELIMISDGSRVARGYPKTGNLLYGYGLFQYDLQNIEVDPGFWRDAPPGTTGVRGLWGDVGACTDRFIERMTSKMKRHPHDLQAAVAAYNGRGASARRYGEIIMGYAALAQQETEGT